MEVEKNPRLGSMGVVMGGAPTVNPPLGVEPSRQSLQLVDPQRGSSFFSGQGPGQGDGSRSESGGYHGLDWAQVQGHREASAAGHGWPSGVDRYLATLRTWVHVSANDAG